MNLFAGIFKGLSYHHTLYIIRLVFIIWACWFVIPVHIYGHTAVMATNITAAVNCRNPKTEIPIEIIKKHKPCSCKSTF